MNLTATVIRNCLNLSAFALAIDAKKYLYHSYNLIIREMQDLSRNRIFHLSIQVTISMLGKILTNRGKEPMFRQMSMFFVESYIK
jgi:hypothetical protein